MATGDRTWPSAQWFREAMLVTLSNPKTIRFYVAFFRCSSTKPFDGARDLRPHHGRGAGAGVRLTAWLIAAAQMAKRVFMRVSGAGAWLKKRLAAWR